VYICICACVLLLLRLWLPLPLLRLAELWELLRNVFVSLCACWALVFEVAHDFLRWLVVDGARWVNSVRGGRSEKKRKRKKKKKIKKKKNNKKEKEKEKEKKKCESILVHAIRWGSDNPEVVQRWFARCAPIRGH